MKLSPLPPGLHGYSPVALLATWFGSGLLPGAPGTWGSLGALPFAWGLVWLAGPLGLLGAVAVVFGVGIWAAGRYARASGLKDCQNVVVDEVVGQWLALLFVPLDVFAYLAAFLVFRAFDIFKPWPANAVDREISGGFGIMLDDAVAGIYALFLTHLGLYVIK